MSEPLVKLQEVKTRSELAYAWTICMAIAKRFPDDLHWNQVIEDFRIRAVQLGLEWKR